MTKSSEMTTAMFEEIKEKLASMNEKLDTITSANENSGLVFLKEAEEQKSSIARAEHQVHLLRGSIEDAVSFVKDEYGQLVAETYKKVNVSESSIEEVKQSLRKRKIQTLKVFVFQVLFAVSALFNWYVIYENLNLKDSELQLSYLKETNSIDEELAGRLDTIFNVYRNEEAIERIKQTIKAE